MQTTATRREFARMITGGLGLTSLRGLGLQHRESLQAAPDQLTRALEILKAIILEHATARDNPWLLIHGIRAMGPGFSVGSGSAVEYLCSRYLRQKRVSGTACLYMPIDN